MHRVAVLFLAIVSSVFGQQPPYDVFPPAKPPSYRVRYEASTNAGCVLSAFRLGV
jgi:hypothetical protein